MTRCSHPDRRPVRRHQVECARRPTPIVVVGVLRENASKVPLIDNNEMIHALSSKRADNPFRDGVRLGCLDWSQQRLDPEQSGARDEGAPVAAVAIPYQVFQLLSPGRRLNQLSPRSLTRGMGSHVPALDLDLGLHAIAL